MYHTHVSYMSYVFVWDNIRNAAGLVRKRFANARKRNHISTEPQNALATRCTFRFARASRMPKKARAMHLQIRARIVHAQKGTRDAPSNSRAHRACLKRHARCTINFVRASRMPKKARAMHLQCRGLRHNLSCDLVNETKVSKFVYFLSTV